MAKDLVAEFLSGSAIAAKAKVPARVVLRRTRMTPGIVGESLDSGQMVIDGEFACDLVAGETIIATGEIVERDGSYFFEAKESI